MIFPIWALIWDSTKCDIKHDHDGYFRGQVENAVGTLLLPKESIGGTITYNSGITLGAGVQNTDEDTTIYNPGLTLLMASEKDNLVSAMIDNRNIGLTILPQDGGGGVGGGW